ncbi:hypothetical protein [uncultured Alistipes sp.]|uniref:hypothetical protein n=1 Tax=uncultured Alistipes sp. TaxID=538949 RepID=UPI00266F8E34|nr:hypothetical protein [uncultured Alistipes sp.]
MRGAQRRGNLNKTLPSFRAPAPGAQAFDERNPAISTSTEQPFRLFEWLQLTLRDDIFGVRAAKAVPERLHGELLHHDPTSVPLQFGRGTEIGMKKVAGIFGLLNKLIYIYSVD